MLRDKEKPKKTPIPFIIRYIPKFRYKIPKNIGKKKNGGTDSDDSMYGEPRIVSKSSKISKKRALMQSREPTKRSERIKNDPRINFSESCDSVPNFFQQLPDQMLSYLEKES